jgi:hypothetical protein
MDERLQEMLDHYEITKTLKEYCFACDRCDAPRMAGVYLEDSWDDHGTHAAPGKEFVQLIMPEILVQGDSLSHLLGQSQIKVDGDSAGAETYFIAVSRGPGEDGTIFCHQLGGRFIDRLERHDGRWLIKHRVVVRDWGISLPIEADWTEHVGLKSGQRSNADPAFAVLGLTHGTAPNRR